ncbi:MAG TPA: PQQ-binding-like beta-propeller repeat protein [Solirubrobacterales bacterium]|nr:PQQ-binding-like beta-propeller repeat protein [Solirubrobacterales bacterium]
MWERLKTVRGQGRAAVRVVLSLSFVALAALFLAACGGGGDDGGGDSSASLTGTGYPNGDLANTRAADSEIKTTNVKGLEVAWTSPFKGEGAFGSFASSPVMDKGVVYIQDLGSNVQAIDQATGEVLWTKAYEEATFGPNGVAVADGRVYGATGSAAFALDQKTGKELWSVPLTRNPQEGINIAPGAYKGVVYVSTTPVNAGSLYEGGAVGILWALDGKTGKKLWSWDTVPKSLWGDPKTNSGGGLWYTPAFDDKGFMYFGVGNPAPFPGTPQEPYGESRPGPNLYTNSIVKMNAKTGKMEWYYQFNPHDIYDWDLQGPPMLVKSKGRELVVVPGKVGYVVAVDAKNGKPVWKRAVGVHNGHDNDGLYAMRGEYDRIKKGTVYPGILGGVIAPGATDGTNVFVPVVNGPAEAISGSETGESAGVAPGGEIVALDVATGQIQWKHKFPTAPAYGATTVVNDLVFVTTGDGKVHGFDTSSGRLAWQESLPAGTNAGVMADGDTLVAGAGLLSAEGQTPELVAYSLGE